MPLSPDFESKCKQIGAELSGTPKFKGKVVDPAFKAGLDWLTQALQAKYPTLATSPYAAIIGDVETIVEGVVSDYTP